MLKPKKKLTKRELKQDKFVTFTLKARDYLEENGKMLIRVGIVALLLIVLSVFYIRSKSAANVQANSLLGEAQLATQVGDQAKAEKLLTQLVDDYDGVTAAGQGCFLLGKIYWEKGDTTQTKKYFKKYIDDYGDDNLFLAGAYAGLADCLLEENNIQGAAVNYEKAAKAERKSPLAPSYLFSAASAYFQVGNFEKAKSLASDIVDNFEESSFKNKAEILLYQIKIKEQG